MKNSGAKRLRIGRRSPSTETNGQSVLRRPGPTKGCQANDDDDDWPENGASTTILGKRKVSYLDQESNPDSLIVKPVA
jgi:hypothetical protein